MNTIREIQRINDEELERGIAGTSASWHSNYLKSAWVYVGNLDHDLSEGDVICVLSQFGEIEDLHLSRDDKTGKSKGFAFCKYEDARSCVLAVDNFAGVQVCGRSLRIDHVENYRLPKNLAEKEEELAAAAAGGSANRTGPGHAYEGQELANEYTIEHGQDLFTPPPRPPPPDAKTSRAANAAEGGENGEKGDGASSSDSGDERDRRKEKKKKKKKLHKRSKEEKKRSKRKRGTEKKGLAEEEEQGFEKQSKKKEKKGERSSRSKHRHRRRRSTSRSRSRSPSPGGVGVGGSSNE